MHHTIHHIYVCIQRNPYSLDNLLPNLIEKYEALYDCYFEEVHSLYRAKVLFVGKDFS